MSVLLPMVTIVTPSLNQGEFIRSAIESVLQQSYSNIEYIVMDAGSTDETLDIVREYGDRLLLVSEPDRGQSHAINKAWRLAQGDILSWLCADDLLCPGAVQSIVDEFGRRADVALVFGRCETVARDGSFVALSETCVPDTWKLIHGYDYIPQPAAFTRTSAIKAVGLVDEALHWGMDWDLFIRVSRMGAVVSIPDVIARARTYPETKTSSGGWRRWRELVGLMRRHGTKRYPAAYFVYGSESLRSAMRRRFDAMPGSRRFWSVLGRRADALALRVFIAAITRANRGWHDDRWAGPTVRRSFDAGGTLIDISGVLPIQYPSLVGQRLSILHDGRRLASATLAGGDFHIEAPLPEALRDRTIDIEIRATHWFVPKRLGMNGDVRRLSYYLHGFSRS